MASLKLQSAHLLSARRAVVGAGRRGVVSVTAAIDHVSTAVPHSTATRALGVPVRRRSMHATTVLPPLGPSVAGATIKHALAWNASRSLVTDVSARASLRRLLSSSTGRLASAQSAIGAAKDPRPLSTAALVVPQSAPLAAGTAMARGHRRGASSSRLEALKAADPEEDMRRFLGRTPGGPRAAPGADDAAARAKLLEQLIPPVVVEGPELDALTDSFGRRHTYLRISLAERCNLRCTYCMPADGVPLSPAEHLLTADEIERIGRMFVAAGVDKIRVTGGEPLVRRDATDICARLGALPGVTSLGMTTNGIVLSRHLAKLVDAGVTALNISLDTLRDDRFTAITRRKGLKRVLKAIDDAVESGIPTVKLNVVVMAGVNDDEVVDFVRMSADKPIDVRFIEYMPFGDNAWNDNKFLAYTDMLQMVADELGADNLQRLTDGPHDTAKGYRVRDGAGQFGFITSMSDQFCGGCNRMRVTADGNLKVCLFGEDEVSLRDAIRAGATDEELLRLASAALGDKHAMLGGNADMYEIAAGDNRPMILIGG